MYSLGKSIRALRKSARKTQKQMAEYLEITTSAFTQYELELTKPQIDKLPDIAEAGGGTIIDLFPNPEKAKEKITRNEIVNNLNKYSDLLQAKLPLHVKQIDIINGYVGAGSSGLIEDLTPIDKIHIDINTISKRYQSGDIQGIQVIGDSMLPYVNNGDIVLFSKIKAVFPKQDGKYVIQKNDDFMVKNIQFCANGNIIISSENKSYNDDIIDINSQDYFSIIGIVVGRILKG